MERSVNKNPRLISGQRHGPTSTAVEKCESTTTLVNCDSIFLALQLLPNETRTPVTARGNPVTGRKWRDP